MPTYYFDLAAGITLPQTDCTRLDIYEQMRTLVPRTEMADGTTIEVAAGKLVAALALPRWKKVSLTHTSFQAAAMTKQIQLLQLPAGAVVHAVKTKHSVAFAGGALTAYEIRVGTVALPAKYAAPFNVFQAVGAAAMGINHEVGQEDHAAAAWLYAQADSLGDQLANSTAGAVDIWVLYSAAV